MEEISFKTKIFIGQNALDRLNNIKNEKIFIVADPFVEQSGMIKQVTNRLDNKGNKYEVFSEIIPDPPIETVATGMSVIQKLKPHIVIAIGGGSAIDAAKAIKEFSIKISPELEGMKFIAIPTTSGTGSEVTSFSVITDQAKQVKYPLISDSLLPQEAILDISLVKSVPPSITADTGFDVLTHAIEAYVSTNANDFSDAFAEKAAKLIFEYLPRAYKDGNDLEAREKVHHASCLAGLAFNMAGLGINHSIAHASGAQFHIPHGRMNALLLTTVIEYNAQFHSYSQYSDAAKRYAKLAKILGFNATNIRSSVKGLIQHINRLKNELHMPTTLRECGISYEQVMKTKKDIGEKALQDRCTKTNPRVPTIEDIEKIIESIF